MMVCCRGGVRLELAAAGAPSPWTRARKSRPQVVAGIHIDRRSYFERVYKRQLESEAREIEALRSCPLECVREVFSLSQFENILYDAEQTSKLVMVDFYSSSCGLCKYLLPQVIRLCKKGCEDSCLVDDSCGVIFLKHNVRDDYDEFTNVDTGSVPVDSSEDNNNSENEQDEIETPDVSKTTSTDHRARRYQAKPTSCGQVYQGEEEAN
ncbi:hypothetical protein L7F22_010511 [Adiantum nelumboides]|nr:hypothetical protein [Adiantum nelumboides]